MTGPSRWRRCWAPVRARVWARARARPWRDEALAAAAVAGARSGLLGWLECAPPVCEWAAAVGMDRRRSFVRLALSASPATGCTSVATASTHSSERQVSGNRTRKGGAVSVSSGMRHPSGRTVPPDLCAVVRVPDSGAGGSPIAIRLMRTAPFVLLSVTGRIAPLTDPHPLLCCARCDR